MEFTSSNLFRVDATRYAGRSVRAVRADIEPNPEGFINGHEYVEMGDGLKWATVNVGASSSDDYGDYFAWGETRPKESYTMDSYIFNPSGDKVTFTKYGSDGKTVLDLEDDAARANWGSTWRMPTEEETSALLDQDRFNMIYDSEKKGYYCVSKVPGYEGNTIFFPSAGFRWGGTIVNNVGRYGYYWTSSIYTKPTDPPEMKFSYGVDFQFLANGFNNMKGMRSQGLSVRPVSD